jgi:hypothetical protein
MYLDESRARVSGRGTRSSRWRRRWCPPERHFDDAVMATRMNVSGRAIRHRVAIDGGRQERHFPDTPQPTEPRIIGARFL